MVCIREDFDYFCVLFLPQGNQIKGQRYIEIIRVFVGISMIFFLIFTTRKAGYRAKQYRKDKPERSCFYIKSTLEDSKSCRFWSK